MHAYYENIYINKIDIFSIWRSTGGEDEEEEEEDYLPEKSFRYESIVSLPATTPTPASPAIQATTQPQYTAAAATNQLKYTATAVTNQPQPQYTASVAATNQQQSQATTAAVIHEPELQATNYVASAAVTPSKNQPQYFMTSTVGARSLQSPSTDQSVPANITTAAAALPHVTNNLNNTFTSYSVKITLASDLNKADNSSHSSAHTAFKTTVPALSSNSLAPGYI